MKLRVNSGHYKASVQSKRPDWFQTASESVLSLPAAWSINLDSGSVRASASGVDIVAKCRASDWINTSVISGDSVYPL